MLENGLQYRDSRISAKSEFLEDLSSFRLDIQDPKTAGGPVLFREGNVAYSDAGDSHNLIIGDTGSMKTLRFVLPLIYTTALSV